MSRPPSADELVDPPSISAILEELLHPDAAACEWAGLPLPPIANTSFRLDHDNIHYHPPFDPDLKLFYDGERPPKEYWSPHGLVRGGIHGGTFGEDGSGSTPMITAVYELLPVAPGAGGTAILPGTHRFSTPRPPTATTQHHRPPWPEEFGIEVVRLEVGDCLLFSEQLMHATVPYTGRGQRRTLCEPLPSLSPPPPLPVSPSL